MIDDYFGHLGLGFGRGRGLGHGCVVFVILCLCLYVCVSEALESDYASWHRPNLCKCNVTPEQKRLSMFRRNRRTRGDGGSQQCYYHYSHQIQSALIRMTRLRPDLVRVSLLRSFSREGDRSGSLDVLEEPFVVRISQSTAGRDPLRVLLVGGEHGRELITAEIMVGLIESLVFLSTPSISGDGDPQLFDAIHSLLSRVEFIVVPNLSVWSRRQVEQGHFCVRKNRQGVDLNRNWDYKFRQGNDTNSPSAEEFTGPFAFSESESRHLRNLAEHFRPTLYINVHSGITEMYMGWDHRPEEVPNADEVMSLLSMLNRTYCNCKFGSAGKIGGYMVYGGSMDYMYDILNVPYSLTFEVYGGVGSPSDCFFFFNPTTRTEFDATVRTWIRALLAAVAHVLDAGALSDAVPLSPKLVSAMDSVNRRWVECAAARDHHLYDCLPAESLLSGSLDPEQTMRQQPRKRQKGRTIRKHDSINATDIIPFAVPLLIVAALCVLFLPRWCRSFEARKKRSAVALHVR